MKKPWLLVIVVILLFFSSVLFTLAVLNEKESKATADLARVAHRPPLQVMFYCGL